MSHIIRAMLPKDKDAVLEMMREFYASPAVFSNGSEEIFKADIEQCTKRRIPIWRAMFLRIQKVL